MHQYIDTRKPLSRHASRTVAFRLPADLSYDLEDFCRARDGESGDIPLGEYMRDLVERGFRVDRSRRRELVRQRIFEKRGR